MPFPDMETISRATNPLMVEELSYDTETMNNEFNNMFDSLTDEQRGVYNEIMSALIDKKGGAYFVYGYGGTGKTYLWKTLSASIKVGCRSTDVENIREFADWLLDIGQGNVGGPNDGQSVIDIPDGLLILNSVDPMGDLISFVYPNILDRFNKLTYFQDRALLAPLNEVVQEINERMLAIFPSEEVEYLSSDSLAECEDVSEDFDPQLYSPDLLNGLKISGMPNHRLVLEVGVPIMLLRNINHKKGLCNGTRIQVISLGRRVIEA
ncbi:uncharacterized protein LOC143575952 [Bidens hawaiensis]|uniref:uncharacterized protein LOC143575952 n=1 Tax=Bidens hawaiensis TaxID=980011 RepID=UPI00404A9AFC